ncbi:hypothetical protein DFP73DRAFT_601607 [Morchella snyderi]|nr:hypothetical protein DFP73DRAFT_601607 [Morchella snyderi]
MSAQPFPLTNVVTLAALPIGTLITNPSDPLQDLHDLFPTRTSLPTDIHIKPFGLYHTSSSTSKTNHLRSTLVDMLSFTHRRSTKRNSHLSAPSCDRHTLSNHTAWAGVALPAGFAVVCGVVGSLGGAALANARTDDREDSFEVPGPSVFGVWYRRVKVGWLQSKDLDNNILAPSTRWKPLWSWRGGETEVTPDDDEEDDEEEQGEEEGEEEEEEGEEEEEADEEEEDEDEDEEADRDDKGGEDDKEDLIDLELEELSGWDSELEAQEDHDVDIEDIGPELAQ